MSKSISDILDMDFGKFDDPFEILYDSGKKKKKKKKKKDCDGGSSIGYEESLREMSKKELRKKCEEMGIELSYLEEDDKKLMRKKILKAHDELKGKKKKKDKLELVESAPYYFDSKSRDFVIGDALDAKDITIFNAMQSLGKLRQKVRSDDGFGELMDRITTKLKTMSIEGHTADRIENAVDVDFTEVKEDAPKQIEAPKDDHKIEEKVEESALNQKDIEKFSEDVDNALADLKGKLKKKK